MKPTAWHAGRDEAMNDRTEKFLAAEAKWKAAQAYPLALFGLCLYIKPDAGPKIGAGILNA